MRSPRAALLILATSLTACSSLLPSGKQEEAFPWSSYQQAQQAFAGIAPGTTTLAELRRLGIQPESTPNIVLLNHADLARRLAATSGLDLRLLPPPLQACLTSHANCYALEIEQKHLERQRYGNFWRDFLNFERKVHVKGWQFDALIILQNDKVVYKLWSGKPNIEQEELEHSPLGPLQGLGTTILRP